MIVQVGGVTAVYFCQYLLCLCRLSDDNPFKLFQVSQKLVGQVWWVSQDFLCDVGDEQEGNGGGVWLG